MRITPKFVFIAVLTAIVTVLTFPLIIRSYARGQTYSQDTTWGWIKKHYGGAPSDSTNTTPPPPPPPPPPKD